MNWKWYLIFISLVILVIFTTQNYQAVQVQFLFWSFKTSRAIVISSTLLIGIIFGWIISNKRRKF